MSIFDKLISDDNKEPIDGMEYIYRLDMYWKPNELDSHPIEIGTIVNNVKKMPNNSYIFNIKESGVEGRCNYGWAFVENTPENIEALKKYDYHSKLLDEMKLKVGLMYENVKTLK